MVDKLDRQLGLLGMSIATSLALEGLFSEGEYAERDEVPAINHTEDLYVNIRTLMRNAYNAFDTDKKIRLTGNDIIDCVVDDWEAIKDAIESRNPAVKVTLYLCEYKSLNNVFKNANFKNNSTAKQVHYETIERDLYKYFREKLTDELIVYDLEIKGERECVLLSHLPLDLLSKSNFPKLSLLESHTGTIKEPRKWNTKLNVKRDGPIVPFNKPMLLIFGDGVMFAAQPMKIRKLLLKISEKRKWNSLTTVSKIMNDIKLEHEPNALEFVARYK